MTSTRRHSSHHPKYRSTSRHHVATLLWGGRPRKGRLQCLSAKITACTEKDPGEQYCDLTAEFGTAYYTRIDAPATPEHKARLEKLSPDAVTAAMLAGEAITSKPTRAPGNGAPIGGLKVAATDSWFAARPSGTENIYKIYAESFKSEAHLKTIVSEAQEIVSKALAGC
jgi:phosphoglucomutase